MRHLRLGRGTQDTEPGRGQAALQGAVQAVRKPSRASLPPPPGRPPRRPLRDVDVRVILRHRTSAKPTCATIDAAALSVYGAPDPTEHPRVVLAGLADRLRRIATAIDAVVDQVEPPH